MTLPCPASGGPASGGWRCGVLAARDPRGDDDGPLVVKFGGSLLSRPDWPRLLGELVALQGGRPCWLVVGGGAVVDGLRAIDRAAPLPVALAHDLAIEAMRVTARLVATVAGLPLVASPRPSQTAVLDVPAWLRADWLREAGPATPLPCGWQVTSDSIAAVVATATGAGLLLAKSVPPPCPAGLVELAAAGWVDDHFPAAAGGLGELRWAAAPE